MNYNEYRKLAPQTCNGDAWHVDHFVDGLVDEAAELSNITKKRHYGASYDTTSIKEEMGDLAWFMSCFFSWYDEQQGPEHPNHRWETEEPSQYHLDLDLHRQFRRLVWNAADALEELESYEAMLDLGRTHSAQIALGNIFGKVRQILYWANVVVQAGLLNWEEIWDLNIQKLHGVRYKGGEFTQDQALERDTAAERAALERGT
jgi:NTP pyrophosphatase (non-canonical NTP hydrolase)